MQKYEHFQYEQNILQSFFKHFMHSFEAHTIYILIFNEIIISDIIPIFYQVKANVQSKRIDFEVAKDSHNHNPT